MPLGSAIDLMSGEALGEVLSMPQRTGGLYRCCWPLSRPDCGCYWIDRFPLLTQQLKI
jgi:hypothetical protein